MGEEIQHIISCDSKGNHLIGSKNYKLHLKPDIHASDFWSIIVYDSDKRLLIKTDQAWPSVHSKSKGLIFNSDDSVDVWFGPKYSNGKECNFIKTVTGKKWYMILRLYFHLEAWFSKKWQSGEIEEII